MSRGREAWASGVAQAVDAGRSPSVAAIHEIVARSAVVLGEVGAAEEGALREGALLGFGPLAAVVADEAVTDILVNGDGRVWTDRGTGVQLAGVVLDPVGVRALAVRLASLGGRRLDDAQPWVDADLPDGIRLHAVLPPLVSPGAHISLRIPRASPGSLAEVVRLGMACPTMAQVLGGVVASGASFLVCGGTGSGKTTLLGALLSTCAPEHRIVIVEDVHELRPAHHHVVRLQGRSANVEGQGLVTMTDLVRQALRMRPDRLVVGEVRGAEVRELLAALNVGHAGAGTVHANGSRELLARLHALGAQAGLAPDVVDAQVACGVQVVITTKRVGAVRRVVEVGVVERDVAGRVVVAPALDSPAPGRLSRGPAWLALNALLGTDRGVQAS